MNPSVNLIILTVLGILLWPIGLYGLLNIWDDLLIHIGLPRIMREVSIALVATVPTVGGFAYLADCWIKEFKKRDGD